MGTFVGVGVVPGVGVEPLPEVLPHADRINRGMRAKASKNFAPNERLRRAIASSLNILKHIRTNKGARYTIPRKTVSCFSCRYLLLHFQPFRGHGALQPTHKHFYKYCQNSYRGCSNNEF